MVCKCVCGYCICGKHHCPRRPGNLPIEDYRPKQCQCSEYRHQYFDHGSDMREPIRQADNLKPGGVFDGESVYREHFIPHPTAPMVSAKPRPSNLKYAGKMDDKSMYRKEFIWKDQKPPTSFAPNSIFVPPAVPFEKKSQYGTTYLGPSDQDRIDCRGTIVIQPGNLKPDDVKMEDRTLYRNFYKDHGAAKRDLIRPPDNTLPSGKFDGRTNYNNEFNPKDGIRVGQIRPTNQIQLEGDRYCGPSTHRADFIYRPNAPPALLRPANRPLQGGAMDDQTMYRKDFPKWPAQPRHQIKRPAFIPSDAPFEKHSLYRNQFKDHGPADKMQIIVPECAGVFPKGPLPKGTVYNDNYRSHGNVPPPDSCRPNVNFVPPTEKIDGKTIYRSHFIGETQAPVGLCRPVNRPLTTGAFEKNTLYKQEFTPKELMCPAQFLDEAVKMKQFARVEPHGFKGHNVKDGHHYFVNPNMKDPYSTRPASGGGDLPAIPV